ncbi:hypothetical protein [Sphingomonas morindae]|uniref:Uncharacterized protein n=1 Tax=Sphingomonas morindae TaxID=1541170 RepID=A0ABY4X7T5_9SPHN|nr:hypothetical protein [Sphingomonas morindae]USI72956.1 hypothetical protein LHA26_00275 [Sphingomonas morindae]
MYAFVDRPVGTLKPGARFLLWAMRGWIASAAQGECPPRTLACGFAQRGALPALPPLNRLLATLNTQARDAIAFHPLACPRIGEDEAILLQLWEDARAAPVRARATLALILEETAVEPGFEALLAVSARLAEAGLDA